MGFVAGYYLGKIHAKEELKEINMKNYEATDKFADARIATAVLALSNELKRHNDIEYAKVMATYGNKEREIFEKKYQELRN